MENIFFNNWESIVRVIIMTFMGYIAMIFLLRISGKRTLSKMNAFDFVITVVFGSSLAAVALNKSISLSEGVVCFSMLVFMQFTITWLSVRFKFVKNIVTSKPTLLLYKGELYESILKKERITIDELYVAARRKGIEDLKNIDAIILETTGDINIMEKVSNREAQTIKNLEVSNF